MTEEAIIRRAHGVPRLLIDRDIERLVKERELIAPFDASFLSGCAYDIRAGDVLQSRNRHSRFHLSTDGYEIESGECVTIESREAFDLRRSHVFGIVANKHSITGKGLFHPITTIDPGYKGKLALTFFNLGNSRYKLKIDDLVAKVFFLPLDESSARIYGVTQEPTYREGSTDFAAVLDDSTNRNDDEELSKMYGEPIRRLYTRLKELDLLESKRQVRRYQWLVNVIGALLLALFSGWAGAWFAAQMAASAPAPSTEHRSH